MVYDWDGKRDICYKMYIEDKKALEEIMEYMKVYYQFAPSKRAFQTQFKRWGFPSKQNPAHKNAGLVARIKELWERNTTQRDMLRILNEEGHEIKERELMRVRAKNRWLLRVPNGMKAQSEMATATTTAMTTAGTSATLAGQVGGDENLLALQQEAYKPDGITEAAEQQLVTDLGGTVAQQRPPSPALSPEVLAKRKERLERLQAESEERWAARKRRRRTRGWAGLPADPPGPPRFPSETTIDESKQYLSLDNEMYRQVRDHFQHICEEAGFIKKTIAGPEKWQAAKDRLIQESPHLQDVFWSNSGQMEAKVLALDVVCTDVTKRMRTLQRRMTIAEAKNALGINPEESRQIRNAFYQTLKADHFTSKLEAGDEHWSELKEKWIQDSELLQKILAPGAADPNHAVKVKAIEILCRDVNKRLRDEISKRDPSRKKSSTSASNNLRNAARPTQTRGRSTHTRSLTNPTTIRNGISTLASQALASAPMMSSDIPDLQIDPSLLQAANDTSFALDPHNHHHQPQHHQQHRPITHHDPHNHPNPNNQHSFSYVDPMLDTSPLPIPVYLRIHPRSQIHQDAKTWVDKLSTRTLAELRNAVMSRFNDARIVRIEGTERETGNGNSGDANAREAVYVIDEDHELDAYLTHVQGRKATFVFLLERG
ncbi:hypothetical protein AJ78_02623 [Emergomyces pasteurianus Ep9510]|uniref:Uncharacterized protein n=1 Tax=Emergomyces pasteurianus Ep9510 TaxID=1447872 RepID=A0A1J9PLI5_9EURO|nr:hypothetical protein AJ78_02623 [Emergomyces pasteurianus Ep9510]